MNQFKIIGMVDAENESINRFKPSDFSDNRYDGVSLYRRKDMKPVVLFASKSPDPARWKVVDGASEFYFRTFKEASGFCQMRGYIFLKGGMSHKSD